ncbi:MAG TPA: hypothetical protein VIX82_01810, partial [Solirubrobacteraceae bacterium]
WVRYSMLAPIGPCQREASCALWLVMVDPRENPAEKLGRIARFSIDQLRAQTEPFELSVAGATLTDQAMVGAFEDVAWELRWNAPVRDYRHVHPALRRAGFARTELVLPHPDLSIDGHITVGGRRLELSEAPGQQAHLWGSKHARSWTWAHCNDLTSLDGEPRPGCFLDGVSALLAAGERELGTGTPVIARIDGREMQSTSPVRVLANYSVFTLTGWRLEAVGSELKLVVDVDAARDQLAGVIYHDPDGSLAYCYNTETAAMRINVYERARRVGGWKHIDTLIAPGRAHFEYAQRTPIPDIELLVT